MPPSTGEVFPRASPFGEVGIQRTGDGGRATRCSPLISIPVEQAPAWETISQEEQARHGQPRNLYSGITHADEKPGRLLV